MVKTYSRGHLTLTLDSEQIFPDDPGNGTPALVKWRDEYQATYHCALDTGQLMGTGRHHGDFHLSRGDINWLDELFDTVANFLEQHS